jgi:hypothetical protein
MDLFEKECIQKLSSLSLTVSGLDYTDVTCYRKDEWNKALANFQHSLKLDQSPINPDPLGAANTSLTCAIILSKLNKYAESIEYAE